MPKKFGVPYCPYCRGKAQLRRTQWGAIWECVPCDARVGCHRGTEKPKGTMANTALRAARMAAHEAFDPLWRAKMVRRPDVSKSKARETAYAWLAKQLGIHANGCHIAMFDIARCMKVIEVCAPYSAKLAYKGPVPVSRHRDDR